jgi:hypothetical protein
MRTTDGPLVAHVGTMAALHCLESLGQAWLTRSTLQVLGRCRPAKVWWLDQALERNVACELRESHKGAGDLRLRVKQCSKNNRCQWSDQFNCHENSLAVRRI